MLFQKVWEWVKRRNIQHCVVDNLHFLQGLYQIQTKCNMDKFLYQDYLVSKFRKMANDTGCHLTLVAHPRKVNVRTVSVLCVGDLD